MYMYTFDLLLNVINCFFTIFVFGLEGFHTGEESWKFSLEMLFSNAFPFSKARIISLFNALNCFVTDLQVFLLQH